MTASRPNPQTALERLASFVANAPLQPDDKKQQILRDAVFDLMGCIVVGAGTPVAKSAQSAAVALGATGAHPVFGTSLKVARSQAAFLNATAGHALDFDDWELPGNTHPTVVIVPALLAAADGNLSGKELTEAYLAGFEVITRLGEALNFEHYDAGWHSTATLGTLGAAAAVSRLLALDIDQTTNALSLALSRATGYTCQFGSNAKPLQAGFAAQAGVECAFLARSGATAQSHAMDHPKGMAALTGGLSTPRLQSALDRLGHPLALAEYGLVLKPWPSCGYTHRIMTCALEMVPMIGSLNDIEKIDLHLPDFHYAILPFNHPTSRSEALFSLPFVCAMGLARRGLTLADVDRPTWADDDIKHLIDRTHIHPFSPKRPDLNYDPDEPDKMVVTIKDGHKTSAKCTWPLGAPRNPMPAEHLRAKFVANTGLSDDVSLDRLLGWPDAKNVRTLFEQLGET